MPIRKGNVLAYNVSIQKRYNTALQELVKRMSNATIKELTDLFSGKTAKTYLKAEKKQTMDSSLSAQAKITLTALTTRFQQLFNKTSKSLAKGMVLSTQKTSSAALKNAFKKLTNGLNLKTDIISTLGKERSHAIITENVSLIGSIPEKYFTEVTGAVMRSISIGGGLRDAIDEVKKQTGVTERRAKLIALDQTRKAYNAINKQRMLDLGFNKFQWQHSGGSQEPRPSHLKIDGHIFTFENLIKEQAALGVPEKDRGVPGFPVNCRCTMRVVTDWETE